MFKTLTLQVRRWPCIGTPGIRDSEIVNGENRESKYRRPRRDDSDDVYSLTIIITSRQYRCRHRPRALRRSSGVSPSGLPTGRSGSREPPRRPTSTAALLGTADLIPSVSAPSRAPWPGTVPPSSSTPAGPCSVSPASSPRRSSTLSSGGTWWMQRVFSFPSIHHIHHSSDLESCMLTPVDWILFSVPRYTSGLPENLPDIEVGGKMNIGGLLAWEFLLMHWVEVRRWQVRVILVVRWRPRVRLAATIISLSPSLTANHRCSLMTLLRHTTRTGHPKAGKCEPGTCEWSLCRQEMVPR